MGKVVPSHCAQRVNKLILDEDEGETQNNEEGNSQNQLFCPWPSRQQGEGYAEHVRMVLSHASARQ